MSEVIIGNIKVIDLKRKSNGLKLFALTSEHRDDDFPQHPIPKNFITDGATIPKFLRKIISPTGDLFRASIPHDYFYVSKVISRRKADSIFRKIVLDDTGNWFLAYGSWLVLRSCGWYYWSATKSLKAQMYNPQ